MYDFNGNGGAAGGLSSLLSLALTVLVIVALWKLFEKAGKPGWAAIIPIYNLYVMLEIIGRPWWWLLLYLIPIVNIVIAVIVSFDFAKSFGQSWVFGLGLLLLPYIFYPILAFGDFSYTGPSAA